MVYNPVYGLHMNADTQTPVISSVDLVESLHAVQCVLYVFSCLVQFIHETVPFVLEITQSQRFGLVSEVKAQNKGETRQNESRGTRYFSQFPHQVKSTSYNIDTGQLIK